MKLLITIDELVRYQSNIVVDLPEGMTEEEFEEILEEVENKCKYDGNVSDFANILKEDYGIRIVEVNDSFPDNPDGSELEIVDVRENDW